MSLTVSYFENYFDQVMGTAAKVRMRPAIREWLEGQGFRPIDPLVAWSISEVAESDGAARADGPTQAGLGGHVGQGLGQAGGYRL